MKRYLSYLSVIAVLIIFAAASFYARSYQNRMADAAESFSALDFDRAGQIYGEIANELGGWRLSGLFLSRWLSAVADRLNEVSYRREDYEGLGAILYDAERGDNVLTERTEFISVNALYRSVSVETDKELVVKELTAIADRYRKIADEYPDNSDAAFNYEYLTQVIEEVSDGKRELPLNPSPQALHGLEGQPIELKGADEIKIFVPKGEEDESDSYSPGDAPRRKG